MIGAPQGVLPDASQRRLHMREVQTTQARKPMAIAHGLPATSDCHALPESS